MIWSYWHKSRTFLQLAWSLLFPPYDGSWFGHIDTDLEIFFSKWHDFWSWLGHIDTSQVAFILHKVGILLLAWSYWHMSSSIFTIFQISLLAWSYWHRSSSILTSLISYSWHGHIDTCQEVFSKFDTIVMLIYVKKYKLHENCLWLGHIDTNQGISSLM